MKFTLAWLKDHLETDAPLSEILDTLTDIGADARLVLGEEIRHSILSLTATEVEDV